MLVPVILSGGSGTRLWPLSRAQYPKQFLDLFSEKKFCFQRWKIFCVLFHELSYVFFSLNRAFIVFLSVVLISIVALYKPVTHPYYRSIYLYICTSILGFISILTISNKLVTSNIGKMFEYLGDRTMPILILHFFYFRIITWCIIIINNDNISLLSRHPLPEIYANNYWFIYIIFGIAFPILTFRIFLSIKRQLLYLYHKGN